MLRIALGSLINEIICIGDLQRGHCKMSMSKTRVINLANSGRFILGPELLEAV